MKPATTELRPFRQRLLPFLACLLLACLYAGAVHATQPTAGEEEAAPPRSSGYGRGYEARHGLDVDTRTERLERLERLERIERVERVERVERPEKAERIERPGRIERIERIERGGR